MTPNTRLPRLAILLGVAGLIPFLVGGIGSVSVDQVQAGRMFTALLTYAAVILSFLGAVHWGLALAANPAGPTGLRLFLGVLPALVGWAGLLVTAALPADGPLGVLGLGVLIVGFMGTMLVESRASRRGLVPPGYMWLRWCLSVVVVAVLITVLVLRLLGAHVQLDQYAL